MNSKISKADQQSFITSLNRKPFFRESLIKMRSEIIKFYSSIHRARTYYHDREPVELGDERWHFKLSNEKFWNYNSPKISRNEFSEIIKDWEMYQDYAQNVLAMEPEEIENPSVYDQQKLNKLYLRFVNNLEEDWLFHRLYFKIFYDMHRTRTILFLDLKAYCATRHVRYIMRNAFGYLEGNYVISLRPKKRQEEKGKVYIPHLQLSDESVELYYSSFEGMQVEQIIADYFIKENIKDIKMILKKLDEIVELKEDVAKEEKEYIFLNPSSYINRDVLVNILIKWIINLGKKNINFKERKSILENIDINELELPNSLFITNKYIDEDIINYPSDRRHFFKDELKAKKMIIRSLFNDLLQYSINAARFLGKESKIAKKTYESRTEYENIFKTYKDLTFMEQDVGCLLVEDGEISFICLLWEFLENPEIFKFTDELIERLISWGLIEKVNNDFIYTVRFKRMARWCMKLMALRFKDNFNEIDYDKPKIRRSYENLTHANGHFSWMNNVKDKQKVALLFGNIIFSKQGVTISENKIIKNVNQIIFHFYEAQDVEIQKRVVKSVHESRFNIDVNKFLRTNEVIDRSALAFPISTIPTNVESKTRNFSIYIGSITIDQKIYSDDENEFEECRRRITDMLNFAKPFFTLLGKPASESLNEAIIRTTVEEHLESTLGRFAHKVKNEGVSVVARMDRLWEQINEDKERFDDVIKDFLELKNGVERFTGTIHILNIAANKFQSKYMEDFEYCIIDVIAEAYCNAFQQFYISGNKEETDKLWDGIRKTFRTPVLDVNVIIEDKTKRYSIDKRIGYTPEIQDIQFSLPDDTIDTFDKNFDAQDIVDDETKLFENRLPKKIIMHSPFLEIFSNAFAYMAKSEPLFKVKLFIHKKRNEIIVTIINSVKEDEQIDDIMYQRIDESAGIQANKLFFKNIGGSFTFSYDKSARQAVAKATINLLGLENY